MDDAGLFGPVLYEYPFARAISDGWLKDYRIVIATVTSRQVAGLLDASTDLVGAGDVPVRMAAAQAALAMTAAEFGLRRCVAFLPRVAQARQFAMTLPATLGMLAPGRCPAGPVSAGYVHGAMTSVQRDFALDRLRRPPAGGWAVVANARCLTEGVDIPAVDSVLFASPKESPVDIVQAIGRALRRHDGADMATIIVPALLPDDGHDGIAAEGGRYETVLRVVRAMGAHDQALTTELGAARARRTAASSGPAELPARVSVLAPPGALAAALDALRLHVITGATSSWHDGYGHALAYHQRHGDLDIPNKHVTATGFRLGTWLTWQRTEHSQGRLAAGRARLLDDLGITWDLAEAAWMDSYRELAAFAERHGHFEVPPGQRTADGTGLAQWAHHQRRADRDGTIIVDHALLLDKIGFPWDAAEARWTRRYRQLADAIARHGGPQNLPPGSAEAGWLQAQHTAYRTGRLPAAKLALLRQAGIVIPPPDPWTEGYQALADYKTAHGHLHMPDGYTTPGGYPLAKWHTRQRERRKAGQITGEQIRLLDQLGYSWDPINDLWQASYQDLADWKQANGHFRLPAKHRLRFWLYKQRKDHSQGKLPADRAKLLAGLGALAGPPAGQTCQEPGPGN